MKTIEQRQVAWMDDVMPDDQRAAFEAGLTPKQRAVLEQEKAVMADLRDGMRFHLQAPAMDSPDFFNHQIMRTIREDEPAAPAARQPYPEAFANGWWQWLGRMTWLGAGAVALAVVLTMSMIPRGGEHAPLDYTAQVIEPRVPAGMKGISAVAFHSEESELTVLWLDGLEYLPDSHAIN